MIKIQKIILSASLIFSSTAFSKTIVCSENHYGWFFKADVRNELHLDNFEYGRHNDDELIMIARGKNLKAKQDNRLTTWAKSQWFEFQREDFCKVLVVIPNNYSSMTKGSQFPINILCGTYYDRLNCEIR